MYIKQLNILNFKNIEQEEFQFSKKYNCFIGKNGVGKTNILDAIYHLSLCKSYFNLRDSQNIKHGEPFFVLQAQYDRQGDDISIYCGLKVKGKKVLKRNGKAYDRFSQHIGYLPLVMVSPEDSSLIDGGSEERRKWLDTLISQNDPIYLNHLIQYNRLLQQRNALLKNYAGKMVDHDLVTLYDDALSIACDYIMKVREEFIEEFIDLFQTYYSLVSLNRECVGLKYKPSVDRTIGTKKMLEDRLAKDSILTYTSIGIHRDDLEFTLEDFPLKKFGSQGQKKSYLIAMKLAQYVWLYKRTGVKPLLLLDDIFDKLDSDRVGRILELVSSDEFGQVFITDTNREHIDELLLNKGLDCRLFIIEEGKIS